MNGGITILNETSKVPFSYSILVSSLTPSAGTIQSLDDCLRIEWLGHDFWHEQDCLVLPQTGAELFLTSSCPDASESYSVSHPWDTGNIFWGIAAEVCGSSQSSTEVKKLWRFISTPSPPKIFMAYFRDLERTKYMTFNTGITPVSIVARWIKSVRV
jgi:hypothetical protein